MKKKFKSWDSKIKGSGSAGILACSLKPAGKGACAPRKGSALLVLILLFVGFASTTQVFAQRRAGRPPSGHQLEGTPILPAGTAVIPDGTVLVVEMDTKLNSGTAQVSDRFLARIATPVVDASGRTLLPTGAIIEGHIASVKKARWAHRSGELELSFDYIEFGDGRKLPLRATIVSGSNPIDEEGNLKAKSSAKRDILVTTGGAVAGAGVGMVTGASILAGGGAGAAAGLTVVLIMKGKNVDIDPGERFNLQLVQPLSLTGYYGDSYRQGVGTGRRRTSQITRPVPLRPPTRAATTGLPTDLDPNSIRTQWARVPVHDVRAERDRDGLLRVLVTAETPSSGWRIYTNHELQTRDTLDIRLMGIPPSQYGARQISHPSASAIRLEDQNSEIRRIIVRGRNGDRYLTIGQGATSAQLDTSSRSTRSGQQPIVPRSSRPRGSTGGSINNFPPSTPTTGNLSSLTSLASQTANQVEILRSNYAAAIGLWINSDGTAESLGGRRTTATETQLYDTLSYLLTSARSLATPSLGAYNRQRAGQQMQRDTQSAQQMWQRVKSSGVISQDLDRQWQNTLGNLRALSNVALR